MKFSRTDIEYATIQKLRSFADHMENGTHMKLGRVEFLVLRKVVIMFENLVEEQLENE